MPFKNLSEAFLWAYSTSDKAPRWHVNHEHGVVVFEIFTEDNGWINGAGKTKIQAIDDLKNFYEDLNEK